MPNAILDIDTDYHPGLNFEGKAAPAQTFYKGTLVGANAAGLLGNLSATFSKVAGVMYLNRSTLGGVNDRATPTLGGEAIELRRGVHKYKQDGSITAANLFSVARAIDDNTLGMAGGIAPAGIIERVEDDGYVFINLGVSRAAAAGNGIA